ncbi:MAG: phosphoenolpyruvate synthase [Gemmatimonadota bacterium]
MEADWIRPFDDLDMADVDVVGGKNASLGEMRRALSPRGVRVPGGFATTAAAYRRFLDGAGLRPLMEGALDGLDTADLEALQKTGLRIRTAILNATLPDELKNAVVAGYRRLEAEYGEGCDVAVRSSATAEDLPTASFAGQQETYLNIRGTGPLLDAVLRCFASLFTDRAISYRDKHGFPHMAVALSVGVQKMVRSDLAGAGVMFSLDPETGFRDAVLISAAWGLGESVVQGTVDADEYTVFKPVLKDGFRPLLRMRIGAKESKLIYEQGGSRSTRSVPVPPADRGRAVLNDDDIMRLAEWACIVEDHYSSRRGEPTPMDMEWAKDGETGDLYLVQARPETVHSRRAPKLLERHRLVGAGEVIVTGRAVGDRIGRGKVRHVATVKDLDTLQSGDVLVTAMTDPDWEPVLKRAAAIVTDRGGRTCHAAIVSREMGIPAVVGAVDATRRLKDGAEVTVSCAEGEEGRVYAGLLEIETEQIDTGSMDRPHTAIMLNIADPGSAFRHSFLPNDGVGLARIEFIIASLIGVHPMALLEPERVSDRKQRAEIDRRTAGFEHPADYFVDRLAEGVGMIAAAFWPKPVIVRLSDLKTNEYASLLGGAAFEPHEENPMLGFRGASRYYDARYRDAFALECRALTKVRDVMGLRNVSVMVPFCRTVEEGRRVIAQMRQNGLVRGEHGLEVYVMCEIPSNVILAKAFAEVFDGFSIGSNDLTQLVLGVDRDSEVIAHLFDERDEAVKTMISQVITAAHAAGRKIGICGQAPSDYPEFAQFLVEAGIDSMSLTVDAVMATTQAVLQLESRTDEAPGAFAPIAVPQHA